MCAPAWAVHLSSVYAEAAQLLPAPVAVYLASAAEAAGLLGSFHHACISSRCRGSFSGPCMPRGQLGKPPQEQLRPELIRCSVHTQYSSFYDTLVRMQALDHQWPVNGYCDAHDAMDALMRTHQQDVTTLASCKAQHHCRHLEYHLETPVNINVQLKSVFLCEHTMNVCSTCVHTQGFCQSCPYMSFA